jgi:predicted O-methyltransferase YrrM
MNDVLTEIFRTKTVQDQNGVPRPLHSNTEYEQGLFLQGIIEEIKPQNTIEIGLAYGVSSLFILEAIKDVNNSKHVIIEPYPDEYWDNIGLINIEKAGFTDRVEFYNDFSYNILPKLYLEGRKFQFAYIDTTKLFDIVHTDVFYILKMLDIGGVFVLDDVSFPSLRKLSRYISKLPFVEIYSAHKADKLSFKKKFISRLFFGSLKLIPLKKYFLQDVDVTSDANNNINYHCIAFRKTAEDNRSWDWFAKF